MLMLPVFLSVFLLDPGVPSSPHVYWEDLTARQKKTVLRAPSLKPDALEYYRGQLVPSDDDRTFALLEGITAPWPRDRGGRAFYLFVFNRICAGSDGALAEGLGLYVERVIVADPAYVLGYLRRDRALLDTYALLLGPEFKFRAQGTSHLPHTLAEFRTILGERLAGDVVIQPVMADFLAKIDEAFQNTN